MRGMLLHQEKGNNDGYESEQSRHDETDMVKGHRLPEWGFLDCVVQRSEMGVKNTARQVESKPLQ